MCVCVGKIILRLHFVVMAIQCICKIWDHKLSSIQLIYILDRALLCKSGVVGKIIISLHYVVMAIQYTSKNWDHQLL